MRKLIITGLMLATALPAAANAQSQQEVRRDRQELRQQQRELNQAYRYGDRRDVREERRDVREARQELREDRRDRDRAWGRDDWRSYRDSNRSLYARGNWRAPFRYNNFVVGSRIRPAYYGSQYYIADPWRYRLPPARGFSRWVRHYDDVLLIDTRQGRVIQVYRGFFR